MVTKRVSGLKYAIRDLVIPAKKLEAEGHKVLKLNIGDPNRYDFDVPDHVKDATYHAMIGGKNYYGDSQGDAPILESIAARDRRFNGSEADAYLLTAGASEGVYFSFMSLVGPGEEALVPSPNYPQYMAVANLCEGKAVEYLCDESQSWNPNIDDIRSKITDKTRALVVINPNNPTGVVYGKSTLKSVIDLAGEYNIPIISDEIYDQLTFGKYISLTSLVKDTPLITLNGISKNHVAPGWRIGYMAFRNCPDIQEACMAQGRIRLCINEPSAWGFKAALDGPQGHVEEMKEKLIRRRDYVMKRIGEIDGLSCVKPKAAFYAFPKIEGVSDDKQWVLDLLQEEHLLVVHGSGFGYAGKGHFRLVYLPPVEVLDDAFNRIERFMAKRI